MTAYDIIKRPIITEQSMADTEMKRYTFEVAKSANKIEIAKAVEEGHGHPDRRFQGHRVLRGHGVRRKLNNGY